MSLLFQILLATLIIIAANGNRNNHQFSLNSFPVQNDSSLFSEFILHPEESSSTTANQQCYNDFGKYYCSNDSMESNVNNKVRRSFPPTLGRLNNNSKDSTQKNHNGFVSLLMNEMQLSRKKRSIIQPRGCDCQIKNDVMDLGHSYFPRYFLNAVCQKTDDIGNINTCMKGKKCKPIEYKVRVLTYKTNFDKLSEDKAAHLLPEILRPFWKFETVTVAVGCYCAFSNNL